MDYLVVMYKRTDRRFRLTHLLGAVKREYGKLRYVPPAPGNTAVERVSSAAAAQPSQPLQARVTFAILR